MIPPLDERGLLPPGYHDCTDMAELGAHFATTKRRELLVKQLETFISQELMPLADGLDLYIGGSFVSDKEYPGDIDCTLVASIGDLALRPGLLSLALDGGKGRIHRQYQVEFFVTIADAGGNDLRKFFSYVGEKTAQAKGIDSKDLRGLVKVNQWTPRP